jgi:hypothetical protein
MIVEPSRFRTSIHACRSACGRRGQRHLPEWNSRRGARSSRAPPSLPVKLSPPLHGELFAAVRHFDWFERVAGRHDDLHTQQSRRVEMGTNERAIVIAFSATSG